MQTACVVLRWRGVQWTVRELGVDCFVQWKLVWAPQETGDQLSEAQQVCIAGYMALASEIAVVLSLTFVAALPQHVDTSNTAMCACVTSCVTFPPTPTQGACKRAV
jgi:hypothetical protein